MTLLITEQDCETLLSIKDAIPPMDEVFRMAGDGATENFPRLQLQGKNAKGIKFGMGALHGKRVYDLARAQGCGSEIHI